MSVRSVDALDCCACGTNLSIFCKAGDSNKQGSVDKLLHQEFHQAVRSLLQRETASIEKTSLHKTVW